MKQNNQGVTNDGLHCRICKKQFPNSQLVIIEDGFECLTCFGFFGERKSHESE